jgi:hypothetical protein
MAEQQGLAALRLLGPLEELRLSRFRVVGNYMRFDESARQRLKDACHMMAAGCQKFKRARENHLLWAAPGTGKTFLVQELARSLPSVRYLELNLAGTEEEDFRRAVAGLETVEQPVLVLVDEADARPEAAWPYELLLPYLDRALERNQPCVFVFAGSSGSTLEEMEERIATRPKGSDLISRVPVENRHVVPQLGVGDRILISAVQLRRAAKEAGQEVSEIEKFALYYIALSEWLDNARQLREFAVRALHRAEGDGRIKFDHLFDPGDPANKNFWAEHRGVSENLSRHYVLIED